MNEELSRIDINGVTYYLLDENKKATAVTQGRYNSSNQRIELLNANNNVVSFIDATNFIKDGMVSNVSIVNGNLVITFNTDSGKSPISIPLTNIFNPSNYYQKSEIDNQLADKQSEISNLESKIGYYECSSEASSASKTIAASNYVLGNGGSIKVKMTNANSAANATLNINSTGTKPLFYNGERASANNSWETGETVEIYYDGTSYYANNVAGSIGYGDGEFDVSVKYPTSGVDGGNTYTLAGALAVLNTNLSSNKKRGGMSIKFVQSSDNKYVQYRLMSDTFNTIPANWQGVDNTPTLRSDNLVKSGGVADTVVQIKKEIGFSETITLTTDNRVALGITGTVVSAAASQSWCSLVIPLQTGVIYDFGELYDSSTKKGWQSIGICARYPQIGDSVTVLTGTQARNFIPTDEQEYALIYIRVSSLPYECTLYAAGIKKDMEDIETDLSDFKDDTFGKLDSIKNVMGEPTVIKVVTSSDYANKSWGGASGVIASNSSLNGYIVHFIKDRKYIINGTILSCQLFTHVPAIGDIDTQGSISPNVDYTPTQDYYGLITFRVEQTISVKKYAYGLLNIAEDIEEETEKNSEDINRGYSSVYYANMIWGGSSTGIIASTSSQNGFVIHIPSGQTELYLDNISSLVSVVAFTHVLVIGNTDNIGGEKFIKSGKQIKCTFPSNANGLWVLFTVRIAEVDITGVTYSLSNFVYDAVKSGLKGKNILCLGDSITEFFQSDGNNYPKYLSLLSGATVYGCGVGGTRLSQRAEIDPTTIGGSYAALDIVSLTDDIVSGDFTTAIAAAEYLKDHASDDNTAQINVLSNIDFDTLDWIIVMGGTNDWTSDSPIGQDTDEGDYTTIKGSLRKIVRNLCTRCPNARILLMTEPPRYFQERNRSHFCDVWENGQGNTLTDVINAIIESAGFSHVPIVDLYRKLGWNEFNWDTYYKYQATGIIDLTHPYSGLRYIAEMAMKYIRNCYY
jgi:lysophospholipase L1-like esterase|nr:MAG TPA: hypothetical protein [Caudoviricetes sp.]